MTLKHPQQSPDCSVYDPSDLPVGVVPLEPQQQELSFEHFPSVFDSIVDTAGIPAFLRKQAPRDPSPEALLYTKRQYPCGCRAEGSGDVPAYCGEHGTPAGAAFEAAIEGDYRKTIPLASGCFDYFPDALCAVAEISYWGNEKHNPGEPLHDARSKSGDDADALLRHLKDRGEFDQLFLNDGRSVRVRHSAAMAWRALRLLQREIEASGAPRARGARD